MSGYRKVDESYCQPFQAVSVYDSWQPNTVQAVSVYDSWQPNTYASVPFMSIKRESLCSYQAVSIYELARPNAESAEYCSRKHLGAQMQLALVLVAECFKFRGVTRITLGNDPDSDREYIMIHLETVSRAEESIRFYDDYLSKWVDSTTDEQRDHFRLVYHSLKP